MSRSTHGFWYGGTHAPSATLVDRIEDEETRTLEIYALREGRERGTLVPTLEELRSRLATIATGEGRIDRRSANSALRRALLRDSGDPSTPLEVMTELGEPVVDLVSLESWLYEDDPRRGTAEGNRLDAVWHPAPGGLLQMLLSEPASAAQWMLEWMSPPHGGPLRVMSHAQAGLSPRTIRRLVEGRVAAYRVGEEIHLLESVNLHLTSYEKIRVADLEGSPLSLFDTLLLHEITEVAVSESEGLSSAAAHVVSSVMERMCGRAAELAEACNAFFAFRMEELGMETKVVVDKRKPAATKVLVVDDSRMARHVVATVLRRLGHSIVEAADGEEAVAMAQQEQPSLIILDLSLPDQSGLEALEQIRQLVGHAQTPVIVVSASREAAAIQGARKLGVTNYLGKPVDGKDLAERIEKCLA